MSVRVTFTYEPDKPDNDHPTGVTEAEYERVTDVLMSSMGAEDIQFEKEETP